MPLSSNSDAKYQHRHYREQRQEVRERIGAAIDAGSLAEARAGYIRLANVEQGLASITSNSTRQKHLRRRDRYRRAAKVLGQLISIDGDDIDRDEIFRAASRVAREMGNRANATDRLAEILITYAPTLNGADTTTKPEADAEGARNRATTNGTVDRGGGNSDASRGRGGQSSSDQDDVQEGFDIDSVSNDIVEFTTDVDVTLADVGGYPEVKETLQNQVVERVEKRHLYEAGDFDVSGGVMLVGPPGTGKTLLAQALSGEHGWALGEVHCASATSALFGKSAKRIKAIFDRAKEEAEEQPTLLFFDEIDTLAPDRNKNVGTSSGNDKMVTAFLAEMNKLADGNHDVFVIGATNTPDSVDSAVLNNKKRMRAIIEMELPDGDAREEIFKVHLEAPKTSDDIDCTALAAKTQGFSGSDIEAVVAEAYTTVVRNTSADADPESMEPITQAHLEAAITEYSEEDKGDKNFL